MRKTKGIALPLDDRLADTLAVGATVRFVRHERKLGRAGAGFLINIAIVAAAVLFALSAHLAEITVWAAMFLACGEFSSLVRKAAKEKARMKCRHAVALALTGWYLVQLPWIVLPSGPKTGGK